jgi:serine/threonine-protein kinase
MGHDFRQIAKLFEAALERPAEGRAAWLAEECASDAKLRREVEEMLAAHERADGILDRPLGPLASAALEELEAPVAAQQVGPYQLERKIGRGGMGVVYQAYDPRLGRFIALKFLPAGLHADETAKERFLDEARAASALDHPNICTIHDIGETEDGRLYIVMALYEGRTLEQRIESGPLTIAESIEIACQAANGLECAHDAGILHRDIKPANVMLTGRGEAKILDLGRPPRCHRNNCATSSWARRPTSGRWASFSMRWLARGGRSAASDWR